MDVLMWSAAAVVAVLTAVMVVDWSLDVFNKKD